MPPSSCGQRRAAEDHVEHVVGGGADDAQRVGAGAAVDDVGAVAEGEDEAVVAEAARQDVVAGAAGQRIVAGPAVDAVGPGAAGQDVVARPAADRVVAAAGIDGVVAALAVDDIDAAVAGDGVAALAADHVLDAGQRVGAGLGAGRGRGRHHRAGRGCRQVVGVDAGAAVVGVVAVADAGHEPVVVGPAVHRVVAGPAGQRIGADVAVERVVAGPARERVVVEAAVDGVGKIVAGAGEAARADEGQGLDVGRQRVAVEIGLHRVGALARVLDHLVAGVVDEVGVVAEPARHGVGAEAAVEPVVAGAAVEQIVAAEPVEDVGAALAEDLVLPVGADEGVGTVGAEDQVADHLGGRRGHRLHRALVVGVGDQHPQLQAHLRLRRHEQLAGAVGQVADGIHPRDAVRRLLPAEGKQPARNRRGGPVRIDDGGRIHRQRPPLRRRGVADRRPRRRQIVDIGDGRRRGVNLLQHPVAVLVDRADADIAGRDVSPGVKVGP